MMQESLARLGCWREQVAALEVQLCGLRHERVAGGAAAAPDGEPPPRLPLCPSGLRRRRLNCSHTMARVTLRDALLALADCGHGQDETARTCLDELSRLDAEIGMLDHRKGAAELARAHCGESAVLSQDLAGELAEIDREHLRLAEALNDLRARTLAAFDGASAAIGDDGPTRCDPDPRSTRVS